MAFFEGDIYRRKEMEEIDMTLEQFHRHQEESFDAFCKKAIRNAAVSAHQQLDEKAEKEPSLKTFQNWFFFTQLMVIKPTTKPFQYIVIWTYVKAIRDNLHNAELSTPRNSKDIPLYLYHYHLSISKKRQEIRNYSLFPGVYCID